MHFIPIFVSFIRIIFIIIILLILSLVLISSWTISVSVNFIEFFQSINCYLIILFLIIFQVEILVNLFELLIIHLVQFLHNSFFEVAWLGSWLGFWVFLKFVRNYRSLIIFLCFLIISWEILIKSFLMFLRQISSVSEVINRQKCFHVVFRHLILILRAVSLKSDDTSLWGRLWFCAILFAFRYVACTYLWECVLNILRKRSILIICILLYNWFRKHWVNSWRILIEFLDTGLATYI